MHEDFKMAEVCLAALQQDSDAFEYVPEELQEEVWDYKNNNPREKLRTEKNEENKTAPAEQSAAEPQGASCLKCNKVARAGACG